MLRTILLSAVLGAALVHHDKSGKVALVHKKTPADNGWRAGNWGNCDANGECAFGHKHREVTCASAAGQCDPTAKPSSTEHCQNPGAACPSVMTATHAASPVAPAVPMPHPTHAQPAAQAHPIPHGNATQHPAAQPPTGTVQAVTPGKCAATVYGGPKFDGWAVTFHDGQFNYTEMEMHGAKCQDISSVEVTGEGCHLFVYDYGDCNERWLAGFQAKFDTGKYDAVKMAEAGAKDNDISCIIVSSGAAQVMTMMAFVVSLFF